jgi:hypothetical protein
VQSARDADGHWLWASAGSDDPITHHASRITTPIDDIVQSRTDALTKAYAGSMAPFRQIILASASRAECERNLAQAYADWDPARLAHELDHALQLCAATAAAGESLKS